MLDTNICIFILNKKPIAYIKKLEKLEKEHPIYISSIVLAELQYGIANSKFKEKNQINLNYLLEKIDVIDFCSKAAFYYGEIRAELKSKGVIIGNNDLLIASHAIAKKSTLVTNNSKEFTRVNNLNVIDWDVRRAWCRSRGLKSLMS
jgi:tRNA(fMet)-specific endonuclease VapC